MELPTEIVACQIRNLAPPHLLLADYLNEPVTQVLMYECSFQEPGHVLISRLDACIEKLIDIVFFDHTCFEAPPKWNTECNASNQFLDLMTSISQSLQLLNHAETT